MWVNDTIYNRRSQLSGGEKETGNGFEIWRRLYQEHHGGAEAVKLGGIRRLQEWPKCTSIGNLTQHLDSWQECLESYNQELLNAPNVLRSMVLGIIPSEYEDEILVRPEVHTWQQVLEFCKRRTTYKRQKALSEMTRRGPSGSRVNALKKVEPDDDDQAPSWALKLFSAAAAAPPPPAPHAATRLSRADRESGDSTAALRTASPGGRTASPNGRRTFNMKFKFQGCWHCGDKGHSRKANPAKGIVGCPKFDKLKASNGGQPPSGYKGAYEKARDLAWEKGQAKRGEKKVNALDEDSNGTDCEDYDDDDSDLEDTGDMCLALTSPPSPPNFSHRNPFEEFAEEDDLDEDTLNHFSKWAHKVHIEKKAPGRSPASKPLRITSLKDLDEQMSKDPRLAALPSNTKKLQRKIRKLEAENIHLEDDEMLALVDTGSNIHAADAEVHFPEYVKSVRPTSASQRGQSATAAGGHKIFNMGKFVVSATADGQDVRVPFNHMKVKLPILSVREMMSKGSLMTLTEHGGVICNKAKNQSIRFIVHDDLWYMKLKVKPPPATETPDLSKSPFGRQGSR